jgi:hypothetical protein
MSSKRFLGPLDAAADPNFRENFVPPADLEFLSSPESHIIYGPKGVGKTALTRALTELQDSSFYASGTLDLNNLSLQRIYFELEKAQKATHENALYLAQAAWRNVILMQFLELVRSKKEAHGALAEEIDQFLSDENFTDRTAPTRFLNQVERFFYRIGEAGLAEDTTTRTRGHAEARRMALDLFSPSRQYAELLQRACGVVKASHNLVAICVDGFDSIVEHYPESRRTIFAGLIGAVHDLAGDPITKNALCVKAFLPKELTQEARAIHFDADKFIYNTREVYWSDDSLKEFIQRRLKPHLRSKKTDFDSVWQEFMPSSIHNSVHNLDENSFAYILRHSQYRPRQLLLHVQAILDNWDRKSNTFRVDASSIPSTVATSNKEMAHLAAHQLEYARKGVLNFVRSFGGATSTITYAECFNKIGRMFDTSSSPLETRQVFDELFDFGVLGVARKDSVSLGSSTARIRFVYAGERVISMHPADDDIVAVCPMFHDYCGCMPSVYGAVIPTDV